MKACVHRRDLSRHPFTSPDQIPGAEIPEAPSNEPAVVRRRAKRKL
jgi:hypothetical protein